MKKIVLAVASACIVFTGAAFADKSLRIVNDDDQYLELTIQVQNCTDKIPKADYHKKTETVCDPLQTVTLRPNPGLNYVDRTAPDDSEDQDYFYNTFMHVASAKDIFGKFRTFTDPKTCEAERTGDVILLSTHRTERVICNDRGSINSN